MKNPCENKKTIFGRQSSWFTPMGAMPTPRRVALSVLFFLLSATPMARAGEEIKPSLSSRPVIVHHSDSDSMTLKQCKEWHKARGWDSCGYNFIIQKDGTVDTARGWTKVGAHTKGYNSKYLGVCFVGKDLATPAQIKSFKEWFGDRPFFGHRNFGKTLCPGKMLTQLRGEK